MSSVAELGAPVRSSHFQWPAIFAGAIAAAGISFTLHAFALGIGLSMYSTAPTWRDSNGAYWALSGLYLLFVALSAFAVGGYVAGRMRAPLNLDPLEMEFRDGMHGLITWGLAITMTALLALGVAATSSPALAPSGGGSGAAQSVAGENIIASELDELFRSDRPLDNITYHRSEAARILMKSSSHDGIPGADRDYLAQMVARVAGLSSSEAQDRAERVIAASAQELHRARAAAVLQAFFVAVALLLGAAVAWYCAAEGGRDRERGTYPGARAMHARRI